MADIWDGVASPINAPTNASDPWSGVASPVAAPPPDTSFISNYGQSFLNAANEGRIGLEGLGQSIGKALYGANPQDASEQAGRQAELDKIRSDTLQSGVQPSGVAGTLGDIAGSIAGNPTSWTPLGEINGISGLAKAGAKVGALGGLIQNTDDNSLGNHLINAGVGAGEGALASAALGKAGQAIGEIPGGVVNRVKGALGADTADEIAAQSDKNWATANQSFKDADATGATLTPEAGQRILAAVKDAIGSLNGRHADTQAELDDFEKAVNSGSLTLSKLDEFRQNFGDVIKDNTKSKIDGGGLNSDGQKGFMAKNAIMDSFDTLGDNDFTTGNAGAAQTLKQGINQWAQAARYDRVASMLNDAGGDPNKIIAGATKLLKNTNGMNADEIAALKDLATRGTGQSIERALGTFGFDFGKAKNMALPALTAGAAEIGGASLIHGGIPLVGVGTALRQTGKWAARGKAQNLLDTIMDRDVAPAARPPAMAVEPPPPSPPMLALPAPRTTIIVDSQRNAIPLTPAAREIIGQSAATHNPASGLPLPVTSPSEMLQQYGTARLIDADKLPPLVARPSNPGAAGNAAHMQAQNAIEAQKEAMATANQQPQSVPVATQAQTQTQVNPLPYKDWTAEAQKVINAARAQGTPIKNDVMARILSAALMNKGATQGQANLAIAAIMGGAGLAAQQMLQSANGNAPAPSPVAQAQTPNSPPQPQAQATPSASPLMQRIAQAESGGNPNARNPNSTASGPLQFTNKTWADMVARYGKQTGITLGQKDDPQAQATMGQLLAQDNAKIMTSKLGRPPTDGELYAAHFFGAHDVIKLINAVQTNPDRPAVTLYPRKVVDANRNIFWNGTQPRSVSDVYQLINSKIG